MALTIQLDKGNSHVYAAGDRVSGAVTYLVRSVSNEIRDISIAFDGNLATRVKRSLVPDAHFDDEGFGVEENLKIFNMRQRLMKGPYSVRPQKLVHKFEFTIPKEYTPEKPDQLARSFVSPYMQDQLPPTFTSGASNKYSSAKVTYILRATVDEVKSRKIERAELAVSIGRFSTKPARKPQAYRFKFPLETWSSLRANGTRLSLRQKLNHIAHLDAPSIGIEGRLHIPEELSPTQSIPITFSALQVRRKETDPLSPILKIKGITITLYGFTEILCWFPRHTQAPQSLNNTHKEELASKTYNKFDRAEGCLMPLDGTSIDIAHKWSLAQFAGSTPVVPGFHSALSRHWHSIHAHVELVHEASNHIMKLNVEVPITVVPAFEPERIPSLLPPALKISPPPRLSSDSQDAQFHELPAYSPSPSPSHSPAPEHRIKRKNVQRMLPGANPPAYPGKPIFVPAHAPPPAGKILRVVNP